MRMDVLGMRARVPRQHLRDSWHVCNTRTRTAAHGTQTSARTQRAEVT